MPIQIIVQRKFGYANLSIIHFLVKYCQLFDTTKNRKHLVDSSGLHLDAHFQYDLSYQHLTQILMYKIDIQIYDF